MINPTDTSSPKPTFPRRLFFFSLINLSSRTRATIIPNGSAWGNRQPPTGVRVTPHATETGRHPQDGTNQRQDSHEHNEGDDPLCWVIRGLPWALFCNLTR